MFEDRDCHAIAVVALNIADDHVQTIHAVANPGKLHHLDLAHTTWCDADHGVRSRYTHTLNVSPW